MLKLTFVHDKHVTKRTFRFKEIYDDTGKIKEQVDAFVGTLYVKKTAFDSSICPSKITVELEW